MTMSVWIAKLIGPIFAAVSIRMIVSPVQLQQMTRKFLADAPLVFISGVLAMTAGLAMVNSHNVWVLDWRVIITVFGWALLISGAARIVAPGVVDDVGDTMTDRPVLARIAGLVWGALGAYLCFKGYG
jgi:hypothetical protein